MFQFIRLAIIALTSVVFSLSLVAQEASVDASNARLSLQADTNEFITGSYYTISIMVDELPEAWLADIELQYDPDSIYIYGTQSRQAPISLGDFFGTENVFVASNELGLGRMRLIVSRVAPAEAVSGSGSIGQFRVFPLRAGETAIDFANVEITAVDQQLVNGELSNTETRQIPVAVSSLHLSISGEPQSPPAESTVAALPSQDTSILPLIPDSQNFTPSSQIPDRPLTNTEETASPLLLIVALVFIFLAVLMAAVLFGIWMGKRRS
jgi:hypothetical protein